MNGNRHPEHASKILVEVEVPLAPGKPTSVVREHACPSPVGELWQVRALAFPEPLRVSLHLSVGVSYAEAVLSPGSRLPHAQVSWPNQILETFRSPHERSLCLTQRIRACYCLFQLAR